ncbi:MAG: ZIP family metal transporter [candidate division WOR-3 bacterium]
MFSNLHPVIQTLIATCFTWSLNAIGAALVFATKQVNQKLLDGMLGFAAGVMIAASFWSLLVPAVETAQGKNLPAWLPVTIGFVAGSLFLWIADKIVPHLHIDFPVEEAEGIKTSLKRSVLLVLAITLHNIPEGLAVGVAFGAVGVGLPPASLSSAIALAIGIGIQNFPEGLAISLPLRREGVSLFKSFWYGQLSALVEPIAGVIGAATVITVLPILPYALSFAAGAMIFVVVEELIPESQRAGNTDLATLGTMFGFALMTLLDVAFA